MKLVASSVLAATLVAAGQVHVTQCSDQTFSDGSAFVNSEGYGCAAFAAYQGACEDFGDQYANQGLDANGACCTCGGGDVEEVVDCVISTSEWVDVDGDSCDGYYRGPPQEYCERAAAWANFGIDANTACCECLEDGQTPNFVDENGNCRSANVVTKYNDCIEAVAPGGKCSGPGLACDIGFECEEGYCIKTLGEGEKCSGPGLACEEGLSCDSAGFCTVEVDDACGNECAANEQCKQFQNCEAFGAQGPCLNYFACVAKTCADAGMCCPGNQQCIAPRGSNTPTCVNPDDSAVAAVSCDAGLDETCYFFEENDPSSFVNLDCKEGLQCVSFASNGLQGIPSGNKVCREADCVDPENPGVSLCQSGEQCVYKPKACLVAPCPQYECEACPLISCPNPGASCSYPNLVYNDVGCLTSCGIPVCDDLLA